MTKSLLGLFNASFGVDQYFGWLSPTGETKITFAITPLLEAIAKNTIPYDKIVAPIDRDWVKEWLIKRELNMDYVQSLTAKRIKVPVLSVWMPDGSALLIDGSHRYMARYLRGHQEVYHHIVPLGAWRPYAEIVGPLDGT